MRAWKLLAVICSFATANAEEDDNLVLELNKAQKSGKLKLGKNSQLANCMLAIGKSDKNFDAWHEIYRSDELLEI